MAIKKGTYELKVSAKGYFGKIVEIDIEAGEIFNKNIKLVKFKNGFTNSLGMKFVYIPPGTFMMGSPPSESGRYSDETRHKVTLTKGFYMQTTEVTQGQWKAVMGKNPSYFGSYGDNCPVEDVSWYEAQEFIKKLNKRDRSHTYHLPTEAQWEYAARAVTTGRFAGTGNLYEMGWYYSNSSGNGTHKVGTKKPNQWGLYDMHGNVWEWCEDWKGSYPSGHVTDPSGPDRGSGRVFRGGGWYSYTRYCRSANRDD